MSYKVYTEDEVVEVETLEDARELVDGETPEVGHESTSGFHGPWAENEDGDTVYEKPGWFTTT